ncbi:hypothetical protein K440DRAFT_315604 [Wilcoxina mikolae CBS 423.85]|nr:hypothetical protein K440DRAFT_315604 [Wilcoxina mikolae CBS 423.85]
MAPKRPLPSTSATSSPKKLSRISNSSPWSAAEDALIISLRNAVPTKSWSAITTSVNKLPPGGRTLKAITLRWSQVLKHNSEDPLSELEKDLLEKAVQDVEAMSDKWWFVAARYMELKKGKDQTREMGKLGAKRWWRVLKEERGGKSGNVMGGKGMGGKMKDEYKDKEEEEE